MHGVLVWNAFRMGRSHEGDLLKMGFFAVSRGPAKAQMRKLALNEILDTPFLKGSDAKSRTRAPYLVSTSLADVEAAQTYLAVDYDLMDTIQAIRFRRLQYAMLGCFTSKARCEAVAGVRQAGRLIGVPVDSPLKPNHYRYELSGFHRTLLSHVRRKQAWPFRYASVLQRCHTTAMFHCKD